jgi:biopolymer transport protein ExbB/TolQ
MLKLFMEAGWVAWPLAIYSIFALAVILERIFTLSRLRLLEDRAFMMLQLALEKDDESMMRDPQIAPAPVTQVITQLHPMRGTSNDMIQQAAEISLGMQRLRLRRYLGSLATIGSTAPFIGLFGTVLGVMRAFQAMSKSGLSGEAMAAGISEALSATALGLLVAIPAVMAYNYFVGRANAQMLHITGHVARLLPFLQQNARDVREKQEA